MNPQKFSVQPIATVSIAAAIGGVVFAFLGLSNPTGGLSAMLLPMVAVSMLGSAVMPVIGQLNRRIEELERRLMEIELPKS